VRSISFAKEVFVTNKDHEAADQQEWHSFCSSLATLLPALRRVNITLWSSNGSGKCFPVSIDEMNAISLLDRHMGEWHGRRQQMWERWRVRDLKSDVRRRWMEYSWLEELFKLKELREVGITWWDFDAQEDDDGEDGFVNNPSVVGEGDGEQQVQKKTNRMGISSLLAGSMVIDDALRRKAILDGGAREGRFVTRL
jgi:hypothetical protein